MRLLQLIIFATVLPAVALPAQVPQLAPAMDTIPAVTVDTGQVTTPVVHYMVSPDSLEDEVDYGANDSMLYDNGAGAWHLYGQAYVNYLTLALKADYIVFYIDSSIAMAQGLPDSLGRIAGLPQFSDGSQSFVAQRLRYNFRTKKGMIYSAVTEQGDLVIHGARTKFVGAGADSLHHEDHIYNEGALITSCDAEVPHYGIRSSRVKTIPNKLAVIGPSNLEIHGVPTPLWLPFGFFPVTSSRRAGLIFPRDYEYSQAFGFGLRDVGYYIPVNDYMDLKALGDIYFNGSWGINLSSTYRKRYTHNGNIHLGFSNRRMEVPGAVDPVAQRSFAIRVSHNQDAKAHPYRRLGGSISIQANDFQSINRNDANSVLTSTYNSNFAWSRSFPGKPYSLNIGLGHSQNTNTKQITINAPNIDFRMNRIYPFRIKERVGREKWFERIGVQYSGNARSTFMTTDSTIFSKQMWDDAQYGVQHRANADLSFNIFRYFQLTPNVNYEEIWFFKTMRQDFFFDPESAIRFDTIFDANEVPIIVPDTINFGQVSNRFVGGLTPYRRFSSGISLNTQIFGTIPFLKGQKGWLRGVRHVIKPNFSFSYEPKNARSYTEVVQTDIRYDTLFREYSILAGGIYSAPLNPNNRMRLGYSLNHIFEAKFFSRRDSTTKNVKIFDNIIMSGDYDFAADSLHFSPMGIRGTTRLLQGASILSFGAVYDFYALGENGRRVQTFYWDATGKPLRFDNLQLRLGTRMNISTLRDIFSPDSRNRQDPSRRDDPDGDAPRRSQQQSAAVPQDKFFDLFNNFYIDHNIAMIRMGRTGRDTTIVTTHTINMRGQFNLTSKWAINIGNIGYDFRGKQLTYPDIGFTRDLHCWDLRFSWQPQRGTYSLFIGVKPGSLDFIKIPHNRNIQDTFGGF